MNKEQFWRIVEDVRSSADPRDQGAILFALQEQLRKLPSAEIMEWQEIFQFYDDAAYREELWAASGAMGAHCSDDGFMDFRSWLISQGRDVYMTALRDPESLAEVDTEGRASILSSTHTSHPKPMPSAGHMKPVRWQTSFGNISTGRRSMSVRCWIT